MDDGTTQSALRHCQRPPDLDSLMRSAADEIDAMADEIERLRDLLPVAYGEGIVDAFTRGAKVENIVDMWRTSDVAQCVSDPKAQAELLNTAKERSE